jgi:ABC-2 type transport system permease protein
VLPLTYASTYAGLYPDAAERAAYAAGTAASPSIVALLGPVYGDSIGALAVQRAGLVPLIVGLISLLTVIRHTRTEEEAGRRELLGATVLGRYAGLTAALAVTYAADLLLGVLTTAGLASADLPLAGSVAFGLAVALTGVLFATVGGLAAQLTSAGGAGASAWRCSGSPSSSARQGRRQGVAKLARRWAGAAQAWTSAGGRWRCWSG